jgi:oligopeptide/dipeptide ABC transporter ATP-binding protein
MSLVVDRELVDGVDALRMRGVHITYAGRSGRPIQAVRGVDLDVARGEIVGLVGESGCGKSSLARAAVGLESSATGTVSIGSHQVNRLGGGTRNAEDRVIQLVFQDPYSSLNPRRRVGSQIADGLRQAAGGKAETRREVEHMLDLIGMPRSAADRFPHEFSGGQRQRLAIGRALAAKPKFLIADEPISALDSSGQASIAALLSDLREDIGVGILLISHDLAVVQELAQRVVVMYLGKIVEEGPSAAVWTNPAHPYTQALIAAIPQPDGLGVLPTPLTGDVPDPGAPPSGCSFHPRCAVAEPRCSAIDPPEIRVQQSHSARCLLLTEKETTR